MKELRTNNQNFCKFHPQSIIMSDKSERLLKIYSRFKREMKENGFLQTMQIRRTKKSIS